MGMVLEGLSAPPDDPKPPLWSWNKTIFIILVQKFHDNTVQNLDGLILDFQVHHLYKIKPAVGICFAYPASIQRKSQLKKEAKSTPHKVGINSQSRQSVSCFHKHKYMAYSTTYYE